MTIRYWDAQVKILSVYFEKDFSSDRTNTTVNAQLLAPYAEAREEAAGVLAAKYDHFADELIKILQASDK